MQEYAYATINPQKKQEKIRKIRVRYSNKTKVLICYALTWSLALLLPAVGLLWVFPYTLVGTAPGIAENLATAVPVLSGWLADSIRAAAFTEGMSPQLLADALAARDLQWRVFVGGLTALHWALCLLIQFIWRSVYTRPVGIARAAHRAVRTYRLTFLGIVLLGAAGGALVYLLGMRFIGGRTVWDWLLCMGGFVLNVLASLVCFRLAAPPAISGKRAFFKRL